MHQGGEEGFDNRVFSTCYKRPPIAALRLELFGLHFAGRDGSQCRASRTAGCWVSSRKNHESQSVPQTSDCHQRPTTNEAFGSWQGTDAPSSEKLTEFTSRPRPPKPRDIRFSSPGLPRLHFIILQKLGSPPASICTNLVS